MNVKKDMLISCKDILDKDSWIKALTEYQLQVLEKRMQLFAERLAK